eukprot:TRINITY_DN6237_c0_g6_i1.p1 TRINITY_DN6237_c0_g6~~TRINITY_DN6237_c0_g6_i1.p1  ORF type:complete len:788 (+),score=343.54 TRINITY_DN6237_c0_g6_i1:174-2537(+)
MPTTKYLLSVGIQKAEKLPDLELGKGKGDFFVKVTVGDKVKETSVESSDAPEWGETLKFLLPEPTGPQIQLEILDHDKMTKDDSAGKVTADLPAVGKPVAAKPYDIGGTDAGKLTFSLELVEKEVEDDEDEEALEKTEKKDKKDKKKDGKDNADKDGEGGDKKKGPDSTLLAVGGKALVIGINYVGQEGMELSESVTAAHKVEEALENEGFAGHVRTLADDGRFDTMPNYNNFVESLNWLCHGLRPYDTVVVYYAGRIFREADGAIKLCPADHQTASVICLRWIMQELVAKLPAKARLIIIMDVHGGGSLTPTATDPQLPFRISHPEVDLANFSAPPLPETFKGDGLLISASSKEVMKEGSIGMILGDALHQLRQGKREKEAGGDGDGGEKPAGEDPDDAKPEFKMDALGKEFCEVVEQRFPNLLDKLKAEGEYVSHDFAAWCGKTIEDMQNEIAPFDIPATRSAPLQNLAREFFKDRPGYLVAPAAGGGDAGGYASPGGAEGAAAAAAPLLKPAPTLRDLLETLHALHPNRDAELHLICESSDRVGQDLPFAPSGLHATDPQVADAPRGEDPGVSPGRDAAGGSPLHTPAPWLDYEGYISTGGDILGSPRLMTLAEAIALADAHPEVRGFSLKGPPPVANEKTWVYFKNKWDLHGAGWTTYKRPNDGPPPPRGGYAAGASPARSPQSPPPHHVPSHNINPWVRQRLVNFYNYYNPAKLPSVVNTLLEYQGHEDTLFGSLTQKYGPEPADTMAEPLPVGWKLVESPRGDLYYKHADGRKQWERPAGY